MGQSPTREGGIPLTAPGVAINDHMIMRNATPGPERVTSLSTTAEHAVRAVIFLAQAATEGPVAAAVASEALGTPRNYLSKTLHVLARAGIVKGQRGPQGGFSLAVPPEALTLAMIVDAVDPPRQARRCLLGTGPCHPARPCAAHARWSEIEAGLRRPLEATTVADLLQSGPDRARTSPRLAAVRG